MFLHRTGTWRKATCSTGAGACVEVAPTVDGVVLRDSKQPNGAVLAYDRAEWRAFLTGVKHGDFDGVGDRTD